jgi:hypothetical protein
MLSDEELNKLSSISSDLDKYKTTLSSVKAPGFSFVSSSDIDINSTASDIGKSLNPDVSSLDADSLLDSVLGSFASSFSGIGKSGGIKIDNSNVKGKGGTGNIITDLINLIISIVQIPVRFAFMSKSLIEATGALVLGIGGLTKSVALGTKDLYMLVIAVLKIFFKYLSCIISFVVTTTIGGCFLIHPFTLFFTMIYLFIMFIVDKIHETFGINLASNVDESLDMILSFEFIKFIHTKCYTCFGKRVRLNEILADVSVIQDIGNMISFDFNVTMPRYMKPSEPLGKASMKSLDRALK